MRKQKIMTTIGMLLSTGIILSGCGSMNDSTSAMQQPKQTDEQQDSLKNVMDKMLPPGAAYMVAKSAVRKQAIYTDDLNKEGKKEGLAFYQNSHDNNQIHLLIVKQENGAWKKLVDTAIDNFFLDYFKISDLNGDGRKELIIGTATAEDALDKQLFIYDLGDNGIEERVNLPYEAVDVGNYDDKAVENLMVLDGKAGTAQKASLYHYDEGKLTKISSIDRTMDAIPEHVINGKLADGKNALYIDSGIGAHSMQTEILSIQNGKLVNVVNSDDHTLLKEYPLYSKDINDDGIIEAGGMYIPKGYDDAAMAEIPFLYRYYDYSSDGTKKLAESRYIDSELNFSITIPTSWQESATIQKSNNGISVIDSNNNDILFEVKWTSSASFDASNTKLKTVGDTIFYIEKGKNFKISNSYFHLLAEEMK